MEKPSMTGERPADEAELQAWRVLVAVPDEKAAEGFVAALRGAAKEEGAHACVVTSLGTARERMRGEEFDLAAVDVALPGGDGKEVLNQVQQWSHVMPALLLVDAAGVETARKAIGGGSVEVLPRDTAEGFVLGPLVRQMVRSHRAEKRLRRRLEEARSAVSCYQGILRNTPDGLCHLDRKWRILVANHTMKRIFDPHLRLTEQVQGRSFGDLFRSPQEFERYRVAAEEGVENTGIDAREAELQRWDGTPVWAQITLCHLDPLRPEAGYVATVTDVTEHRRTRQALRFQEQLEALVSGLCSRFLTLRSAELEADLYSALKQLGEFLGADRCFLLHPQEKGAWPPDVFEWSTEDAGPAFSRLGKESAEVLAWSLERFRRQKVVQVGSVAGLDARVPEREFLLARSVKSYVGIPLEYEETLAGCLGFHSVGRELRWEEETISQLRFLGKVFVNALKRRHALDLLTRLSSVVEQTADSVLITDTAGKIEYVNPAFERKTGFTAGEAVGQNPRIIRSGKHDQEFYRRLWSTLRSGHPFRGVIVNRRKGGELYYEAQTITPIRDERGSIRHYVSTAKDITEQVLTETQLREKEERLRHLLETPNVIPWEADADRGKFTYVGPQAERILGYPVASWLEAGFWAEHVHPEDRQEVLNWCERASHSEAHNEFEYRMIAKSGEARWIHDVVSFEPGAAGVGVLRGFLLDVTEKKRLETQQEVLQRLTHHLTLPVTLNQVARIIAYEARTLFHHDALWFSMYDETHNALSGVYLEDTAEGEREPAEVDFDAPLAMPRPYGLYSSKKPVLINRMEEPKPGELIPFGHVERLSRSLMFAPILWEDRVIAVLSVQSYTPGRYAERDLHALEALADQCGGVLVRLRAEEERETLQRLSQQLTTVRSPRDLGLALSREAQGLLGYEAFWFSWYDPIRRWFSPIYVEDCAKSESTPLEYESETVELSESENDLYASGKPGLISDVESEEGLTLHEFGEKSRSPRSVLYAPVSWGGRVIAVLSIQSYASRRYTSRELHLLQAFADQCGGTLARVRAEEEREVLQRLSHRLLGRVAREDLGRIVSEESRRVFGHDAFLLDLLTEPKNSRLGIYYEDLVEGEKSPVRVSGGDLTRLSPCLRRVVAGESILLNRERGEFGPNLAPFGDTSRPSLSMMFVPIRRESEVIGVLSVQSYTPGRYSHEDLRLLEAFAAQCGTAVSRVWATEALARETATLNHIIEYNPYAILLTDPEGRPVKVNPAYVELLGAAPGPDYSLFADPELEKEGLLGLLSEVRQGATVSIPDVWHPVSRSDGHPEGGRVCLRSVVFPTTTAPGAIENYVVMHQDVTDRKRAEAERQRLTEELIEKERLAAMGQTIAEVAHCMKNIFTAVNGGIYLLEQSLKMNRWDLTRRSYQTLRQSATRLYLFLMNMLDFSKKREGMKEEVSVRSIIEDVIRMLQANADSRNVSIRSRVDREAEVLKLDSQGLFRTLLNLGLNAIDAMPKGGELEISAAIRRRSELLAPHGVSGSQSAAAKGDSESELVAAIEVADTGTGIPEDALSRIFEPFYSTKGSRGTGLGLSSARKFIQEQGGEIRVASQPGKGTRFQLVFALSQ